jgi:membrane protein
VRTVWRVLKHAIWGFIDDDVFTLAAALAFYAMLSVSPLLVLLITSLGFMGDSMREGIVRQVTSLAGPEAAEGVSMLLEHAQARQLEATISAAIGIGGAILGATAVFARLQYSLNLIFDVRTKQGYVIDWLYKRFLSLLMVIAMGIVLVGSVVISSIVAVLLSGLGQILFVANLLSNLVVYTVIFVIMFKVLPDIRISWGTTLAGALITAILFLIGGYAISMYFTHMAPGSVYGAAGSLAVLLLWIFYSAIIIFFGAELTQAYGLCCAREIIPNKFAEWGPKAAKMHDMSQGCERVSRH